MQIKHWTDVPAEPMQGVQGATIRWVIGEGDGAPHFALRVIEVPPGEATPHHSHWWEHEIFILEGQGMAVSAAGETPVRAGSAILTGKDEIHQVRNIGKQTLRIICLIPHRWLEGLAEKRGTQDPTHRA